MKRLFDTIRTILKRPMTQAEVDAINAAIEPDAPTVKAFNEALNKAHRTTSEAGIDLIHSFEGLAKLRPDGKVEAYPDPGTGGDPWTIGWGSTGVDPFNGGKIRKGTVWTRAQCDERFKQHLAQFERAVLDGLAGKPASQAQFDAMVSLAYKIGADAFKRSTLLRKHRAGDFPGAEREFLRWSRAGGKVMTGLVRRREAEAAMYRKGS